MRGPRILVPTDFSDCALEALHRADHMARQENGSLWLLHVYPPMDASLVDFSYVQSNEEPHQVKKRLAEQLHRWLPQLATPKEQVTRQVVVGSPVEEIVAASHAADLVVMGTHGRSGVRLFLLGSVTERVVRGAVCSVFVVKTRPQKASGAQRERNNAQ